MPGCQADDFAEEAFVHRTQDFHGQNAKVVRTAMLEVEALENGLEGIVIHGQMRSKCVRRLRDAGFFLEVEQAGVVFLIGLTAQSIHKTVVDARLHAKVK